MHHIQKFAGCIALAAAVLTTAHIQAEEEAALIAVLASPDSPKAEKAITCKKLAVFGSKDAVPELAKLLNDEQLVSWARIALESIPGTEADQALQNAMGTVKGRSLIGVINSIGVRGDATSVPALVERLKDPDTQVATAAAAALGKIDDESATVALRESLAIDSAPVRSAVAEGCVLCAERLLAAGKSDEAAAIYEQVRTAELPLPKQRLIEATRGVILAQGAQGIPLLLEQLRSDDKQLFRLGLTTARELEAQGVVDAVVAELDKATPERGALLLLILADRRDESALPAVLKIAKSGAKPTRIAAIQVLARSDNAASVPPLFGMAVEDDIEVAAAAKSALIEMPGELVDAELLKRLNQAGGSELLALIELVGQRGVEATPALLKAADSSDMKLRTAALTALGETVKQSDLSVLISRVISVKNTEDTPAALKALRAAAVRMPNGEACAAELASALAKAPTSTQVALLEILGEMNNPRSLAALSAAAKSGNTELQDAATRVLGQAITLDAGPVLLDLAKVLPDGKFKIRAIRGYIRLVRQFNMPDPKRVDMCVNAFGAATRVDEQKMVLEVAGRYPSVQMLKVTAQAAKVPALKAEATRVANSIAKKHGGDAAGAEKLLKKYGQ